MKLNLKALLLFLLIIPGCSLFTEVTVHEKSEEFREAIENKRVQLELPPSAKIDTVIIDEKLKVVNVIFNKDLSYIPFREQNVKELYSSLKEYYGDDYKEYSFSVKTLDNPVEKLIPNYYRDKKKLDRERLPLIIPERRPVIKNISRPYQIEKGLASRNILLWPSHGWYYDNEEGRWEWQRPRLFQSVEDLHTFSLAVQYLAPMLENAGASLFIPRERDIQKNEVIIDDTSDGYTEKNEVLWTDGAGEGFGMSRLPLTGSMNPFKQGKFRSTYSDYIVSAEASWTPDIPETGEYSVYISYNSSDENVTDAHYSVYHRGGVTDFIVNQQAGGRTWQYLGRFKFEKGINNNRGRVVLTNQSNEKDKIITADAVRFGGGTGIVERGGTASGRPKFMEAARYWLQYAGMPDTLVYSLNADSSDYNDDYQGRAEYGNYLYGAPFGPLRQRDNEGLGIPIDLSLAFHTDAGIAGGDSTIGTLAIYSIASPETLYTFPDGMSRLASRDLADILQSQIVDDIKKKYNPGWNRRNLRDARYSEAVRPNFPSVLLELLSHQNFTDMKYLLDPRFRFDAARSVYKAILKFLSVQYSADYVVQPLPVNSFSAEFNEAGDAVLRWRAVYDPLDSTAVPEKYIVYKRINDGGFDNGIITEDTIFTDKDILTGQIYSYKVSAVNPGGESFPSEILSVCRMNGETPFLIINGFDRICGPASIETKSFSGFLNFADAGVPDRYDLNFTGRQYDFNPFSEFISNDEPGHGASHADFETEIIAGNNFDYPFVHGKSLKANNMSFVSASDEAVGDKTVNISKYRYIDLILGEEKQTGWPDGKGDSLNGIQFKALPSEFQKVLKQYLNGRGNIFISGAYTGTDLFNKLKRDSSDIRFAEEVLKYQPGTGHACKKGEVYTMPSFSDKRLNFNFNVEVNDTIYAVEAPDEINPVNGSETILRYAENHFSAAVGYRKEHGAVVFGFPFETIPDQETRNSIMKLVLDYLR